MAVDFENISDTITGFTQYGGGPTSEQIEITDQKNRNRTIVRVVIVLIMLAIIATLTYYS